MTKAEEIREMLDGDWIPAIYERKVRSQRTRAVQLPVPSRLNEAEILFTLLGIELKVGRRRIACPDLATARYLQVFARLGCANVAVPYDITKVSPLADELEVAWQRLKLLVDHSGRAAGAAARAKLRSALVKQIREAVAEIGPGEAMPEFKETTSQRNIR